MASEALFSRKYKLTVGPASGTGKEWDGLRIMFKVHKTASSTPNKLEVDIYNLSASSRHFIEGKGKDWAVVLEAGYVAGIKTIFSGRLELASSNKRGRHNHHHQGPDWVTKVKGFDGIRENLVVLSKSFGPKTSESAVINEIAREMGSTVGTIKGLDKHKNYAHGRQISGSASAELDSICRTHNCRWSIQDGVLHILPYGEALDSTAFLLTPSTGLVGSPELTERGVKVTSLLLGGINPGKLVQLKTADVNGLYIVETLVHRGDTHYQDWYTEMECFAV
jgi:hypothetical protein